MSSKMQSKTPTAENSPGSQPPEGINSSAPSTVSAARGDSPDEKRKEVTPTNPEASSPRARSVGDAAVDLRQTSYPQNEAAQDPGDHPHGDRSFRCSDAVYHDCGWSVTGNNEDEILGYWRAHAREAHAKNEFTPEELANARRAIHKRAA